jgi:hypothetical protein
MLNSTDQQKTKYFSLINGVLQGYNGLIDNINRELTSYGSEFRSFIIGKTTQNYIVDSRKKLIDTLVALSKNQFSKMIDELNKLKEDYVDECFPGISTTDTLELDFIGKELSVMTIEELSNFYQANLRDKNKVRLFDIELKKRKMTELGSKLVTLENLRAEYEIEDLVIEDINTKMNFLEIYRQLVIASFPLFSDINNDIAKPDKSVSCNKLVEFIEVKSRRTGPQNVNVKDLLNVDFVY